MGQTAISWTATVLPDGTVLPGYSFNPWIGCTKISQGCAHCYAETQNKRYNWTAGWGPGAPRKRTSETNWKKPIQWARDAVRDGVTRRVFCASLADVFDPEVPQEWRNDLWGLIYQTGFIGGLEWLLLTKRPENIKAMIPARWENPPDNVRMGVTGEDQENFNIRTYYLNKDWWGKNFISIEPMLGDIRLGIARCDWIICGGESGAGCREMHLAWARELQAQCSARHVPFFMKQLGGFPDKRHNPAEWPEDLQIQQFPGGKR